LCQPPALSAEVIFEIRSGFLPEPAWTTILLVYALPTPITFVGMKGHTPPPSASIEVYSSKLSSLGWSGITVLPLSASLVARMTGVCHCTCLLYLLYLLSSWDDRPEPLCPASRMRSAHFIAVTPLCGSIMITDSLCCYWVFGSFPVWGF
jgi:hypothetical protein